MVSYYPGRVAYLTGAYPPQQGGDDGMVHDGHGRIMAMLLGQGEIAEALKGIEPVYWFTPGTRYVRMVEKLIFGDTNYLWGLQLACFPIVVFYLMRQLAGMRWAWAATAVFLLMPVGNLSFLQYVTFARIGYGEAWGSALFLGGLVLLLRSQPRWGGSEATPVAIWCGGAALALSMFIRPNLAIAVVWLGCAYTWASWRDRDWRRMAVLALGLGVALWMPLHNWMYGGEFYLISKSGATLSVPLGVGDYASAAGDLARGSFHTRETDVILSRLKEWLLTPGFGADGAPFAAMLAQAVNVLALLLSAWLAIRWLTRALADDALGVLAVSALMAHVPLLFIFSTYYRYAITAWDLSLLVLIAAIARKALVPRRRPALSRIEPLGVGGHQ